MDANYCFCLTLLLGNLWKLSPLPCLFFYSQLLHMILPFSCLIHFLCNLCRELLWGELLFMIHCPEVARGQGVISATQSVTADSTWKTWPQPVAARVWAGWWHYAKVSPHGITERKRRAASCSWSVFLSYKLICMWAFRAPLKRNRRKTSYWGGIWGKTISNMLICLFICVFICL